MNKIKKETKLLYTFIILFMVSAFLLLFNIVFIVAKPTPLVKQKDFETISNSVVYVQTYIGFSKSKQGSGFIYKVDKDKAYILTNNHVIDKVSDIKVYVTEEKSVDAKLLGYDKFLDVAVLSIDNNGYKALKLNDKNNLNVGDTVYTIGTPLNIEFYNSTASGIISKTSRLRIENNADEDILMDMIQTDIITKQGNSGGPLLNEKLEVIGICTSSIDTVGESGISFAVPITKVINKLEELEKEGQVSERKISNLKIADVKESDVLYKYNLVDLTKEEYGVVVLEDNKETSLKKGDIIIEINNDKVKDMDYYKYYLNNYSKDDTVSLIIKRNDKVKTINVTLK